MVPHPTDKTCPLRNSWSAPLTAELVPLCRFSQAPSSVEAANQACALRGGGLRCARWSAGWTPKTAIPKVGIFPTPWPRQNGITVTSTWHLLQLAHRKEWIDADTLWGYVQTLRVNDRGTPPGVRDRAAFDKWLPT